MGSFSTDHSECSNSRKPWQYGTRGYTGPGGMGDCQGQDGHLSWECHGTGQGFGCYSWADLDLENLDVDFIEDLMLRAKPTNAILQDIRNRQIVKLEKVKDEYWEKIKDLGEEKKEVVEEI